MATGRIRRPKSQEVIYNELTNKKEFGMFNTYKDLFMLGLVVGFLEERKVPFDQTLEEINWQVFNMDTDESVINMIAYLETEDLNLIYDGTEGSFKHKIKIAEEYAAGGVEKVYELVIADQKNAMQVLIDYIQKFEEVNEQTYTTKQIKDDINL
ncbi:hypothetical protein [Terribacillus saccharophilus]|uniref:hypothetical protein n=1 Tax=Terribacillus saccharophilus TaxID=361277 RepID=UPI000C9AE385|nr:hypothetical protein [Terribacillus goriensis]